MIRQRWVTAAVGGVVAGVGLAGFGAALLLTDGDPMGLAVLGMTSTVVGLTGLLVLAVRETRRTAVGLSSVRQHSQRVARQVTEMTERGTPVVATDLTASDGLFAPLWALTDELPQLMSRIDAQLTSERQTRGELESMVDRALAELTAPNGPLAARVHDEFVQSTSRGGEIQRLVRAETTALYSLIESLLHLMDHADVGGALPPMGGWAIRADLAAHILRHCQHHRPQNVVEAGSGVSTVILAAIVRKYGKGHVTALEHDPGYAERTHTTLLRLELEEWATVVNAPLGPVTLNDEQHFWYDLTGAPIPPTIDLLLIDGPPGPTRPMARYPAVPVLRDRLTEQSVVLLDDARRHDEQQCVKLWQQRFGCSVAYLDHLVGTAELQFPATRPIQCG